LYTLPELKGRQVKVPTYLVPAKKVYEDLFTQSMTENARRFFYKQAVLNQLFLRGVGGPKDTFGRMNKPEVCVSTTNRISPVGWVKNSANLSSFTIHCSCFGSDWVCD